MAATGDVAIRILPPPQPTRPLWITGKLRAMNALRARPGTKASSAPPDSTVQSWSWEAPDPARSRASAPDSEVAAPEAPGVEKPPTMNLLDFVVSPRGFGSPRVSIPHPARSPAGIPLRASRAPRQSASPRPGGALAAVDVDVTDASSVPAASVDGSGHQARQRVHDHEHFQEQELSQFRAATTLQTAIRGRAARSMFKAAAASRNEAATQLRAELARKSKIDVLLDSMFSDEED